MEYCRQIQNLMDQLNDGALNFLQISIRSQRRIMMLLASALKLGESHTLGHWHPASEAR